MAEKQNSSTDKRERQRMSGTGDVPDRKKQTHLEKSIFNIINIEPQVNFVENDPKNVRSIEDGQNSTDQEIWLQNPINARPHTPSKVLEMFERISPRNLMVKDFPVHQEQFLQRLSSNDPGISINANSYTLSDSDSEILDDDEFEIMNCNRCHAIDSVVFQDKIIGIMSGE